jgi:uncharacterized OB-fold protein
MAYGAARALPGKGIAITTNPNTEPFWEAAKTHRLTACRCGNCGAFRMPPSPYCPKCQSSAVEWPDLPGTGTVFSFAICTHDPKTGEPYVYVPVVVDLDGAPGARLVSNLTGIDADAVTVGMRVTVDWNPIEGGWVLPVFRPAP